MPHVTVPEDTFQRLSARAAALNISVDDLVRPALDRLAETGTPAPNSPPFRSPEIDRRRRLARSSRSVSLDLTRLLP